MLPFQVLVTRPLAGAAGADITVSAADLLAKLAAAGSCGAGGTRPGAGRCPRREAGGRDDPGGEVVRVAAAASRTLRDRRSPRASAAGGGGAGGARRAAGPRADRGDRPPRASGSRCRQRLVQAVVRMGFLGRVTAPVIERQHVW